MEDKKVLTEIVDPHNDKTEISPEEMFDKKLEKTKEELSNLTLSRHEISFRTEQANTLDEAKLFELYRQMDNDAIISGALDLFADNVTQENPKTGHVVSVSSTDKSFETEVNDFLWNIVNIDTESWNIVRSLAQFGKVILDTRASNGGVDWAFIEVDKPENILPLTYGQDNIKYYAVKPEKEDKNSVMNSSFYGTFKNREKQDTATDYIVEPRDRYIAGFNARKHLGKMVVSTESTLLNGDKEDNYEELYIRAGKSLLEGAVEAWQTLSTLEDSLFVNRLLKSTTFNIVSVDVSDTNNKEATKMINDVKASLKSSESIDKRAERYSNRQSPLPINDFIYVPHKGDKGTVEITQYGGEVGEIDLSDIEYYRNKLFAALGMLKAYLGFEETTPGGLGDTTLTILDERFSRKVKRLRASLGNIVKQMVEYYWLYSSIDRTLDNLPEYKLELGKISTREEQANRDEFTDKMGIAESVLSLASAFPDYIDDQKLFTYIFEDIVGIDIKKIDNTPEEKETALTLKQLKESGLKRIRFSEDADKGQGPAMVVERVRPKHKTRKIAESKINFVEVDFKTIMESKNVVEVFDEYEIYIDTGKGQPRNIRDLIENKPIRKLLGEKTYKDLKNKTKELDPERIKRGKKLTGKYLGIDDNNYIKFRVTAEDPEKNKKEGKPTSYETEVSLKDLIKFIEDRKTGETDLSLVRAAVEGNIAVGCTCPASKYWGQQYNGTKEGYSTVINKIEPTRNKQYQQLCKHSILMVTILPFWVNTIVRDLRAKGVLMKDIKSTPNKGELEPEQEKEAIDIISDIEQGTKPTKKDKPVQDKTKTKETDNDKDKNLKDKVAGKAKKTKTKPKTKPDLEQEQKEVTSK